MQTATKMLFLCLGILCLVTPNCTQSPELDIRFIEQPIGGKNITLLSCVFEGKLVESTTPITVSIEWWNTDSIGTNEQRLRQESHTFESVDAEQVGTELTAPANSVLEGYYWVRIIWPVADHTDIATESDQVFCYEGPWGIEH